MSGTTWSDIEQWYIKLRDVPPQPAQIKLTNAQLNELKLNTTSAHLVQPGLLDIPIVLVGTVEESTPYQLARGRLEYDAAFRAALDGNNRSSRLSIR